ncbi:MAG TPA: hypothetical protein VMH28_01450 [Candidatus Acidoferrales bacterium]|nr:hypothetical protein [Candidatus Acidoferrales bacterium]
MSVWPLATSEGQLVSVSVRVHPNELESLLEVLAQVSFPINPQIYHDAAVVYRYADDREETESVTLVEFPAYEGHLAEVRAALASYGFEPGAMLVVAMLDEIQSEAHADPPPPGAAYIARYRVKHRAAVA